MVHCLKGPSFELPDLQEGHELAVTFHLAVNLDMLSPKGSAGRYDLTTQLLMLDVPVKDALQNKYRFAYDCKTPSVKLPVSKLFEAMRKTGLITPDMERLYRHVMAKSSCIVSPVAHAAPADSRPFVKKEGAEVLHATTQPNMVKNPAIREKKEGAKFPVVRRVTQRSNQKVYLGRKNGLYTFSSGKKESQQLLDGRHPVAPYLNIYDVGSGLRISAPTIGFIDFGIQSLGWLKARGVISDEQSHALGKDIARCRVFLNIQALPEGLETKAYLDPGNWLGDFPEVRAVLWGNHNGQSFRCATYLDAENEVSAPIQYKSPAGMESLLLKDQVHQVKSFTVNDSDRELFAALSVLKLVTKNTVVPDVARGEYDAVLTIHRAWPESKVKLAANNCTTKEQHLAWHIFCAASACFDGSMPYTAGQALRVPGNRGGEFQSLSMGQYEILSAQLQTILQRAGPVSKG